MGTSFWDQRAKPQPRYTRDMPPGQPGGGQVSAYGGIWGGGQGSGQSPQKGMIGGGQNWQGNTPPPNMNLQPGNSSGGWQAVLPGQPGSNMPNAGAPSWLGQDANWWRDGKNQEAANGWANTQLPIWQMQQNQLQYGKDFNESQRQYNQNYNLQSQGQAWNQDFQTQQFNTQNSQWDRNFAETQGQNKFNNQLAQDQFGQTKWRDTQNQNNWSAEFGQTQLRDQRAQNNFGLEFNANRADTAWNQGFQQNQFGETQAQNAFSRDYQNRSLRQQADLAKQQNDTALQSSRYAAFGRNRAPATGWSSYG